MKQWFGSSLTPEQEAAKAALFGKAFNWEENLKGFSTWLEKAKGEFKAVETWGAVGFCWGGKVSFLVSFSFG